MEDDVGLRSSRGSPVLRLDGSEGLQDRVSERIVILVFVEDKSTESVTVRPFRFNTVKRFCLTEHFEGASSSALSWLTEKCTTGAKMLGEARSSVGVFFGANVELMVSVGVFTRLGVRSMLLLIDFLFKGVLGISTVKTTLFLNL